MNFRHKMPALCSLVGVLILTHSLFSSQARAETKEKDVSETLLKELSRVIDDLANDDLGKQAQKEYDQTAEQFKEKMLAGWRKSLAEALTVTKEDEEKFKRGEFSDEPNKKKMNEFIAAFQDTRKKIPQIAQFLLAAQEKGELKGDRLELATRVLQHVMNNRKALEKR